MLLIREIFFCKLSQARVRETLMALSGPGRMSLQEYDGARGLVSFTRRTGLAEIDSGSRTFRHCVDRPLTVDFACR